jgi:hypothetical protein
LYFKNVLKKIKFFIFFSLFQIKFYFGVFRSFWCDDIKNKFFFILIHFWVKNILKNNHNHTPKHTKIFLRKSSLFTGKVHIYHSKSKYTKGTINFFIKCFIYCSWIRTAPSFLLVCLIRSVVVIVFQSIFYSEINQNNIFFNF